MEDHGMTDFFSGIKNIGPTYPIKPVRPAQKDRETGKRRKGQEQPETSQHEDDDDKQPHIDEHV